MWVKWAWLWVSCWWVKKPLCLYAFLTIFLKISWRQSCFKRFDLNSYNFSCSKWNCISSWSVMKLSCSNPLISSSVELINLSIVWHLSYQHLHCHHFHNFHRFSFFQNSILLYNFSQYSNTQQAFLSIHSVRFSSLSLLLYYWQ